MEPSVVTVYRYTGEHQKLGGKVGEVCSGGHAIQRPKGSPAPPLVQTLACDTCAAKTLLRRDPRGGTDVTLST